MKVCSCCNNNLQLSEFRKDRHNPDGLDYNCKSCKSIKEKQRHKSNPLIRQKINDKWKDKRKKYYSDEDRKRAYKDKELRKSFNLTLIEYEKILAIQNGVCYICKREETSIRNRRLAVDHNHITGKVRGLLCSNCNRGLGLFRDNKDLLIAATKYLEKNDEN